MNTPFDPSARAVFVTVWVAGPAGVKDFTFRVDTGANRTAIRPAFLYRLGYEIGPAAPRLRMRSATGEGVGRTVIVSHFIALEQKRSAFPMMAQELPPAVTADGLLGLDFLRGQIFTLDFARGRISLRPPHKWWWPWG